MNSSWPANSEKLAALPCVLFGIAVSISLASKNAYFLPNFTFFWVSQLAILIMVFLFKPRPAIISGVAFALALYLAAFGGWLMSRRHPESMAWLGYIFSLPGAVIGSFAALYWSRSHPAKKPLLIAFVAAIAVLIGIFINQAIVCNTVMYCGGK